MAARRARRPLVLRLEPLETREVPSGNPWLAEPFDAVAAGALPGGWAKWASQAGTAFGASSARALSPTQGLAVTTAASGLVARAWFATPAPADLQATAAVFLNSLVPGQVFARGSGLDTAAPTYYAAAVTRGLTLQLVRVVKGATTVLGQVPSSAYTSNLWVRVTVSAEGTAVRARVQRVDNGQYLTPAGKWQADAVWAIEASDGAIAGGGLVGVGRPASYSGTLTFDDFTVELPAPPSPPVEVNESFDTTPVGSLPAGWSQWVNSGPSPFQTSSVSALSTPNSAASVVGGSGIASRAWVNFVQAADVQAGAAVLLNTLAPAGVLVRGTGLDTAAPSYYALQVTRGLEARLSRVNGGMPTTLAVIHSADYVSGQWVRVTLYANGGNLRGQVYRTDTGQYLDESGHWQLRSTWAINLLDAGLSGPGMAGLVRPAAYAGSVYWDDFRLVQVSGDSQPPTVSVATPANGAVLSGVVTVQAQASDAGGIARVEFYLDGVLRAAATTAPYGWVFDTHSAVNGAHTLAVRAVDAAGNIGRSSLSVTTRNDDALPRPEFPAHYSHIRIAELAYSGTPFGTYEQQLLRTSVDLVVPGSQYLYTIQQASPNTPRLIYTNVSSLYQTSLTDWLTDADARGLSREEAFYHVAAPRAFTGSSPSSQPVTWFWGVYRSGTAWTNLTYAARSGSSSVTFARAGDAVVVGFLERFREINVTLASAAAGGWAAVLEYATAVDAAGNPTAWAPLPTRADTTAGLTQSGQVLFDPPADWKAAEISDSARLFYVRFRTVHDGTAPAARTILGRDYVNARGTISGVIPAFDAAADANSDGYLSDAEYARRTAGMDARFLYESRLFQGNYGQMRFAVNPSLPGLRNWAVDYQARLLDAQPLATGLFVDNSSGLAPAAPGDVLEPAAAYAADYGALLGAVARRVAPRWLLANTIGGGPVADEVLRQVQGSFEEFAIRPLAHHYGQFEELAAQVARRAALRSPAPYQVLDSHPSGSSPLDARTQLATLAYYYLLADPDSTFLDFYGGYEPHSSWSRHWSGAAAYNVGRPLGAWSLFATGADPANAALTYRVYQRAYGNALVLYKPLSYGGGKAGTLADATATTHALGGTYVLLRADGTLGPAVTSITLRNGEGAILVRAG